MSHPKRVDHFKKWAQLMVEHATVDKVHHKSVKGKRRRKPRRKRIRRMRRTQD